MDDRICAYCGKPFTPEGRNAKRQKYCKGPHFAVCEVCGKRFEIANIGSTGVPKTCSKECSSKLKNLNMQKSLQAKYGASNPSQIPEIHAKALASIAKKSSEIAAKRKQTMIERYGAEYPMQSEELKSRIEATNLERYGSENPAKNQSVKDKIRAHHTSAEYREAYTRQSMEKYGTAFPAQSEEVQNKMKATCQERYGADWAIQAPDIKSKMANTLRDYYKDNEEAREKLRQAIHEACLKKFGVDWPVQRPECRLKSNQSISKKNREIHDTLESLGFNVTYEEHLESFSYDLCLPDQKVLLEIDPTYTHNAVGNHWSGKGKAPNYHLNKTEVAIDHGYRCIHIFDWDDVDKIVATLIDGQRIYARNCTIQRLSTADANEFFNTYHLQGACRGQEFIYGLSYNSEIIMVASFGKSRYNRNYAWELLRLCTKTGYAVIGGAGKLFYQFIYKVDPESVISYCDRSKFSGAVYEKLGMQLSHVSPPAKVWSRNADRITDNLLRQRGYDQLFKTNYGNGTSNEALMIENNWLPVYDCGQNVYVWRKNK